MSEHKAENFEQETVTATDADMTPDELVSGTEEAAEENVADELAEWKDKAYRLAAEMENLKKRTQKEVGEARQFAISSFAREMLGVQDNFLRALDEMKKVEETAELKTLKEGVAMVAHQMDKAMEKFDVRAVKTVGEKFNPEQHQAMFEVPTDEHEAGTVVQEVLKGYTIGERLLRPAMVGVAKANA